MNKISDKKIFRKYKEVYLRLMRYWLKEYYKGDPKAAKYINQLKNDYEKFRTKFQKGILNWQAQESSEDTQENREDGNQANN